MHRQILSVLVFQAGRMGIVFGLYWTMGRRVGPVGYGIFEYAVSITTVLSALVSLGWSTAMIRFLPEYTEKREWKLLLGVLLQGQSITLLVSILLAVGLWNLEKLLDLPATQGLGLTYAALLLPFFASTDLRRKSFHAFQRVKLGIFLEDMVVPLLATLGFVVLDVLTLDSFMNVYLTLMGFAFLFNTYVLWNCVPPEAQCCRPHFEWRQRTGITAPVFFGELSQIVMKRFELLYLGSVVDMTVVGVYAAAKRFALLISFMLASVNAVVAPRLARSFHSGQLKQFFSDLRIAMGLSLLGAAPIFIVEFSFPQQVLAVFGNDFVAGAPLLRILILGQIINAATGPVGFALLVSGNHGYFARSSITVAGMALCGWIVIVPFYGPIGAAWVSVAGVGLLNLWQLYIVYSRIRD